MNQPSDDHNKTVEERLADLEQLFGEIIKNEKELIKLSKRHTFNLREISGQVGSLGLDLGDVRERFDTIEQTMATKTDIGELKATQNERFDRIEQVMATKEDVTSIESTMATKDDLEAMETRIVTKVAQLLQQKSGE
jgi:predicted  nucleic acid-binding Zn-ribbon protein